jgi:hypothetical protein
MKFGFSVAWRVRNSITRRSDGPVDIFPSYPSSQGKGGVAKNAKSIAAIGRPGDAFLARKRRKTTFFLESFNFHEDVLIIGGSKMKKFDPLGLGNFWKRW